MPDYPYDFIKAVTDLINNWEGSTYTKASGDAGCGTKFGISSKSYPNLDIEKLTRDEAIKLYYYDYWVKTASVAPLLRAKVFNMGVLMGVQTAIILSLGCNTLTDYRCTCKRHFQGIVIKHPEDAKFLEGWTRRAMA